MPNHISHAGKPCANLYRDDCTGDFRKDLCRWTKTYENKNGTTVKGHCGAFKRDDNITAEDLPVLYTTHRYHGMLDPINEVKRVKHPSRHPIKYHLDSGEYVIDDEDTVDDDSDDTTTTTDDDDSSDDESVTDVQQAYERGFKAGSESAIKSATSVPAPVNSPQAAPAAAADAAPAQVGSGRRWW